MKKIATMLILSAAMLNASAQAFRVGAKFVYNSTWMFNNNISDRGDDVNYKSAFGSSFGLTGTYHFTEETGISMDILFATHNAKYESKDGTFEVTEKLTYTDVPVLLRLGPSGSGGYAEIGPMISFLSGAKEDATSPLGSHSGSDFKNDFTSTTFSGIIGFGYDFAINDNILLNAGLRFGYGFSDGTKEFTEGELQSTDRSLSSALAHYDSNNDFNYASSHRVFGGLNIGLIYKPK